MEDAGWQKTRDLAATDQVTCCLHGRAETVAALHRKFREGVLTGRDLRDLLQQFKDECDAGAFRWLALSPAVVDRVSWAYAVLPKTGNLRAADAIHLACASEAGLKEIYSNDERLLAAAGHVGLAGLNILKTF